LKTYLIIALLMMQTGNVDCWQLCPSPISQKYSYIYELGSLKFIYLCQEIISLFIKQSVQPCES